MKHSTIPITLSPRQIAAWFSPEARALETSLPIIASIPRLQRGLVWNAGQIEILWDSLLRGFPIGSLVVCQRIPGQDDGNDESISHHLVDGQQRSHAVATGFEDPYATSGTPGDASCSSILWIDLLPEMPPNSTREFLVRLTTSAHPWGFRRSDTCETLHAWQIQQILKQVGLDPASGDYVRPSPRELFPAEAEVAVPLAWLLVLDPSHSDAFWRELFQRCEATGFGWAGKVLEFLSDTSPRATAARDEIIRGLQRVRHSRIVALPAPDSLVHATRAERAGSMATEEVTAIEHLFQRLNRQGTRLDGEELAYCMIKAYWPQIAGPIQEIVVRRMPASRLAMMAARAALTVPGAKQLRGPLSVGEIRRMAGRRDEDADKVLRFITDRLKACCNWIEGVVLYDARSNPGGLLPAHLARIARSNPEVYLLLLCIADRCVHARQDSASMEDLRLPLLALVCRMAWFATDSHQTANHVLAACADGVSPTVILQATAHAEEQGWLVTLPTPSELACFLDLDGHEIESWTWHSPIHGDGEQAGIDLRQRRWGSFLQMTGNRDLLMYAQRGFIAKRFNEFDPSRRDLWEGHNRPWDFDHIHARKHIYNIKSENRYQSFLRQWQDTIGNLRAWPFEDNRSDSAELAESKIQSPEQLVDSFVLPDEIPDFSMGRLPLHDEAAARRFANTCLNRMIRIYQECWNLLGHPNGII